ncbi:uncharacterized protein LOC106874718 [Octopus bimaculoides]|uniref:Uncharacterized protein n=1 Tax=Octopus bimaculoides TaxID=37653 RepID=A0A0L8GTS5_OCTBM|nr:uncharacterized protein LOC106874718 [Octopus bimaculoides]XP_014778035.1 uncharacterized protein LOC106874718 [Octopus bimaculoides]|eukprot:XP_014778034.1 PREDICTED: uncharacterized protein LOC106874718 [Octopus bimaculoides]
MKLILLSIFLSTCHFSIKGVVPQQERQASFKAINTCGLNSKIVNASEIKYTSTRMQCLDLCSWNWKCNAVTHCRYGAKFSVQCHLHENINIIHDCKYHEKVPECSSWKKVTPCHNNGIWHRENNTCDCFFTYKDEYCKIFRPSSCKQVYQTFIAAGKTPSSNKFVVYTPDKKAIEVFCDFKNTFGVTYISKDSLLNMTNDDLQLFVPDSSRFVIRYAITDGSQTEATLKFVSTYSDHWIITLGVNETLSNPPINYLLEPYIHITGLPISCMNKGITMGYNAEGTNFTYSVCDENKNNYFAFYANANQLTLKHYSYVGMVEKWKSKTKSVPSSALLTEEFLYLLEIYFGGCGGLVTCNAEENCAGASPGFIFSIP